MIYEATKIPGLYYDITHLWIYFQGWRIFNGKNFGFVSSTSWYLAPLGWRTWGPRGMQ